MGQRNMTVDLEMQQQSQGYVLQPEPCIFLGSFPQLDIPGVVTAAGNVPNLEAHPLSEPYDNAMFYGAPRYHQSVHHPHHHHASSLDAGISTAPNFYLPYVSFHAPPGQLPSSSSHGAVGITSDEHERNAHVMDPTRGSYKRKNAEGTPGNSQYLSSVPAPSSFPPLNTTEAAPFSSPQFRGAGSSAQFRPGATTMDPVLPHDQNNFIQGGNYADQPFPPAGSIWFDHHWMCNGRSDGSPSPWSPASSVPYMPGSSFVSGSIEPRNMCLPRYHETSSSRNPTASVYPSPLNPRHHYFGPSPPPIQRVHPHMALAPYGIPANYDPQSTIHDTSEMGSTHVGSIQPTGFRIYLEDRVLPEATFRRRGLPRLRILPAEDVALVEVRDFNDTGHHVDHHRDMRLDIEDMSYEELLSLSERIGTVNTGLSEEKVEQNMKTRSYLLAGINLDVDPASDLETDSCTICQENYKNQEKIGTLECGHEYHAGCLKKWLFVKNVCPICKSEALAI
ncbi:PREDICTED: E3 ubiquitin-protein ligase MBR2-like [Tarenaya hassleriana]|uniref:E3 ubiquitin-protein ligase MBR2-like n=1 Tax=Tarenaya hassleriana TaxID=28532 RepID=UPI00053C3102|nr:PREDICTED: E3 ubiquitin-protein ligase MBR2-like [Tarenaya hassleriana]